MAKDALYFPHDFGARNDPKLQKLLRDKQHEGIGLYWCIVELLYENGGELLLDEMESYAFALRTQCDIMRSVIFEYNLFQNDGTKFWSNSVKSRLQVRHEKSEKARISAEARWNNANAMRTHSERNAIKKERKKETNKEINKGDLNFEKLETELVNTLSLNGKAKKGQPK